VNVPPPSFVDNPDATAPRPSQCACSPSCWAGHPASPERSRRDRAPSATWDPPVGTIPFSGYRVTQDFGRARVHGSREDSSLFRFSPSTRRLPARTQRKLPISTRSSPRRYGRRPAEWCPNPCAENQSSVNRQFDVAIDPRRLHYRVDTSRIARDDLIGQIVVARNREDKRLLASRLIRFDHTDVLVFDQCENQPALLANGSSWRILGTACADRKS
jgi:hypothetical protein